MKKIIALTLAVAPLCALAGSTAVAGARGDTRYELRYALETGAGFGVSLLRKHTKHQGVMGSQIETVSSDSIDYRFRVERADEDGMDCVVTYTGRSHATDDPSVVTPVDFSELSGRKVQVRLSHSGLLSALGGFGQLPTIAIPDENQTLDERTYIRELKDLFPVTAGRPVSVGEEWVHSDEYDVPLQRGTLRMHVEYRYRVVERTTKEGIDCLHVIGSVSLGGAGQLEFSAMPLDLALEGSGKETILFAHELGMALTLESSVSVSGRAVSDEMGMTIPFRDDYVTAFRVSMGHDGGDMGVQSEDPGAGSDRFDVRVEEDVMVSVRDHTRLVTDLYFPVGLQDDLPTILIRTPYGKENRSPADARWFAERGYVVAVQNVRGKPPSEGRFVPVANDAKDGYDTLTWLARQPWSNGRIGTYGCSYLGENQVILAKMRHPNHTAMIPQAAGGAIGSAGGRYRYFGIFEGGALRLDGALSWFMNAGVRDWDGSGGTWKYSDMLSYLPVGEIISAAGGETDWEAYLSHPFSDSWWDDIGYIQDADTFDVPALHINSWFDYGVSETAYLFNLIRRNASSRTAADNQFLVISPTKHCGSERATENTSVHDLDLGDARLGHMELYVRWFDYWLKGVANGVTEMPRVQLYVMGRNIWRSESEWPLARTQYTPFYLHSAGAAGENTSDGTLTREVPGGEPPDRYRYDPGDPTPSCELAAASGKNAPSAIAQRPDVLTYTSSALADGMEVTGPLRAVLYVSSSAVDTDFVARVIDVGPDGRSLAIQRGIMRSRFRSGFDREEMMTPGDVYRVEIDMKCTSYYFASGHRIRLELSSSHFPYYDRNLNDGSPNFLGAEWVIADNIIYHDEAHSSHVLLPIVE